MSRIQNGVCRVTVETPDECRVHRSGDTEPTAEFCVRGVNGLSEARQLRNSPGPSIRDSKYEYLSTHAAPYVSTDDVRHHRTGPAHRIGRWIDAGIDGRLWTVAGNGFTEWN